MERRLSAILAADVVGYSRLMEADEPDTFARVRVHRKELFEPEIGKHHGRIFKLMGDGLLAEFGSVVDAVDCAVVLQRAMTARNQGLPNERRIDVRIGITLGDIIVDEEDCYGEGVNIAARLQQIADPGGICIGLTGNHLPHARKFDHLPHARRGWGYQLVAVTPPLPPLRTNLAHPLAMAQASQRLV